jgi:hypothetical protein
MAIGGRNRYVNFRLRAIDNAGRDHYLLVPFNEPMIVVAASSEFALSDASGTRLTNDAERIPVVVPPGKSYPPITLNVGKR